MFLSLLLLTEKHRCFITSSSFPKPALTEEEVERKSNAIIGEYLLINDLKVISAPRGFSFFQGTFLSGLSEYVLKRQSSLTVYHLPVVLQEALQCVTELCSASLLYIFVRNGIELTLEHSVVAREHVGLLLYHLVKAGTLPTEQYYKGWACNVTPLSPCLVFSVFRRNLLTMSLQAGRDPQGCGGHGHRYTSFLALPCRAHYAHA